LNNWWNDAKRTAEQKAGVPFGCNFHDIKAKGISDYEGSSRDKQLFSGHKTEGVRSKSEGDADVGRSIH
jgi:hypothetical protein